MTAMTHDEIKQEMIWAGKVLVNRGHDDFTRGHISMRLPDNPGAVLHEGAQHRPRRDHA